MTLQVNGEPRAFEPGQTLSEVIEQLQLPPSAVLVEHNGLALRREEWPARTLAEGDRLEIIRIVAGG